MTHSRTLWIGGTAAVVALAVAVLVTKGQSVKNPAPERRRGLGIRTQSIRCDRGRRWGSTCAL
jgi:hypothetical protein